MKASLHRNLIENTAENLSVIPPTSLLVCLPQEDGNNRFWVEAALWGGFCLLSPGRSRFRCDPPPWRGLEVEETPQGGHLLPLLTLYPSKKLPSLSLVICVGWNGKREPE